MSLSLMMRHHALLAAAAKKGGGIPMPDGYEAVDYLELKELSRTSIIGDGEYFGGGVLSPNYVYDYHYAVKTSQTNGSDFYFPAKTSGVGYWTFSGCGARIGGYPYFACRYRSGDNYSWQPSISYNYNGRFVDVRTIMDKRKKVSYILDGTEYFNDRDRYFNPPSSFCFYQFITVGSYFGGSRFYSLVIKDADENVKFNFVPAKRKSDNRAFVIETVTQTILAEKYAGDWIPVKA